MYSESENETIFKDVKHPHMTRSLIYHGFIHSIIRRKHKEIADKYYWTQFYAEEKRVMRKIAALKQMHSPNILTRSIVTQELTNYDIVYNDDLQKKILEPILTSYFYLKGTTTADISIDFIHKSFSEYLLAEYFIESIYDGNVQNLNVGIPSKESVEFLDGLLELWNKENIAVKEYLISFIKSLSSKNTEHVSIDEVKRDIIKKLRTFFEEEQIVLRPKNHKQEKIWVMAKFPYGSYC